jgi:hypothetical protein
MSFAVRNVVKKVSVSRNAQLRRQSRRNVPVKRVSNDSTFNFFPHSITMARPGIGASTYALFNEALQVSRAHWNVCSLSFNFFFFFFNAALKSRVAGRATLNRSTRLTRRYCRTAFGDINNPTPFRARVLLLTVAFFFFSSSQEINGTFKLVPQSPGRMPPHSTPAHRPQGQYFACFDSVRNDALSRLNVLIKCRPDCYRPDRGEDHAQYRRRRRHHDRRRSYA